MKIENVKFLTICLKLSYKLSKNPLRILDTKNSQEQEILSNAPQIFEYLSEDDKAHFSDVEMHLKDLNINFEFDPYLVRGLDYYNRTILNSSQTILVLKMQFAGEEDMTLW